MANEMRGKAGAGIVGIERALRFQYVQHDSFELKAITDFI